MLLNLNANLTVGIQRDSGHKCRLVTTVTDGSIPGQFTMEMSRSYTPAPLWTLRQPLRESPPVVLWAGGKWGPGRTVRSAGRLCPASLRCTLGPVIPLL